MSADPVVLIGPGSEWFWTAVSGLVLAVTFIAIWRQLRLQASTNAFTQVAAFQAEMNSERLVWAYSDVLTSIANGTPPADIPDGAASAIGDLCESIGLLVRGGHLDRRVAYTAFSFSVQYRWAVLAPFAEKTRAAMGMPAIFEHFEWLAGEMATMDRARGAVVVFDDVYLAARIPASLEWCRDQIRISERSKVVYVRDAPDAAAPDGPERDIPSTTG